MLLFKMQTDSNGLCWLLRTFTFVVTLLQLSSAPSGYAGLVTAVPSVNPPGEVDPKSLSILIGDNATITCRLSEANSSKIWFYETTSKRSIKQPDKEIKINDPYTAHLLIQDAVEQKGWYQCMVGNQGIGLSALYVGRMPQNVTDFACIVYDYEYMQCSFTKPKNMLMTTFDLEYRFVDDSSVYKCDLSEVQGQEHKLHSNVTGYLPVREKYLFTLIGSNAGGKNIQHFTINNHKIVIPSALDIIAQNVTSDSVTLSWEKLKISYYRLGLLYEINIRDNRSDWHTLKEGVMVLGTCNVVVNDLYAFWPYSVTVRVKSNAVDRNDESFWSEASTTSFVTKATRPHKAPDTPWGSFYIDSTETQLRLYWGHLPDNEHSGPGFHYIVNEIDSNGVVKHSIAANETTLTLPWRNESVQLFSIKSANDFGESDEGNIIRVFRSGSHKYELNENNIAKVYHNSSYTLSWSPPENIEDLVNYTVFWCLPKIEVPNQCKGPISFKYLGKFATNFTTEPKDRSLNLAISANYIHYTKGMQWARCSGDVSTELMKTELEVNVINESTVMVKWSSGSICSSILKGYNLTYCQALEDEQCMRPEKTIPLLREYRNYTIHGLPSYTKVCMNMFMFSSSKRGPDSDITCVRTRASAPSPPKNLEVKPNTVTSKSATIEWSIPDTHNGILSHYTIHWRKVPDTAFEKATTSIDQTSFNLTGLNSYSNYEVYVTAHTIEESRPSKRVSISTLIGIPSSPRNINIYDNDTVIYWDQPDMPSGRHVFYIVALLHRYNANESIYERVSIVRDRSCRFQLPECSNPKKSYTLEVRAINVAGQEEIDTEIKSMSRDLLLAGAEIDQGFCKSENNVDEDDMFNDDIAKFYFASPWITAPRAYYCSADSNASIYAVAFVIVIAFAVYICYWIRNKYYKMKNIKVILPEGLVDQVSNYKFAGNALSNGCDLQSSSKKEFHSDISRSNDCLVAFGHKENHNLISNFHNRSTHALSSLSSTNSSKDHPNDDQIGEHPSLETTNEELSSNSSSSSNCNLTYNNHHQIGRLSSIDSKNTLAVSACEEHEDDEGAPVNTKECNEHGNAPNVNITQNIGDGGYVTHNTQLLASILNASERAVPSSNQFPTPFPAMTNDGYIQPSAAKQLFQPQMTHQPTPPTPLNGYTCIEALGKMSTMPDETLQNRTSPALASSMSTHSQSIPATSSVPSTHTSPVITDLEESDHHTKDVLSTNAAAAAAGSAVTHHQTHNNNNTIYGYVTQQQLANFGTNVALAKELNT